MSGELTVTRVDWVYFRRAALFTTAVIVAIVATAFFTLGGPKAFFMNAEGFTMHISSVVSPSYEGELKQLLVKPGQYVNKGQLVAVMDSMKMHQDLMGALTDAGTAAGGSTSTQKLYFIGRYRKLVEMYDDGKLYAKSDGYVGSDLPKIGEIVKAGDPVVTVSEDDGFVIAYINEEALFKVNVGDKVYIQNSTDKVLGEVSMLYPHAEALPKQVQYPYAVTRLGRAVRIDFLEKDPFPINQHVIITKCYMC